MKKIKMVGRSGQVIELSGEGIFGVFTYLYYKGYKRV